MNRGDKSAKYAKNKSEEIQLKNRKYMRTVATWQSLVKELTPDQLDSYPSTELYRESVILVGKPIPMVTNRELIQLVASAIAVKMASDVEEDLDEQLDYEMDDWEIDKENDRWENILKRWATAFAVAYSATLLDSVYTGKPIGKNLKEELDKFNRHMGLVYENESSRVWVRKETKRLSQDNVKYVKWVAQVNACKICEPLDGKVFLLEDLPDDYRKHVNCRCELVPVNKADYLSDGGDYDA